ncbi:MAG: hypothetical protein U5L72_01070 [Bacteroidales bacterium]|nr:hypothetical protein [Bacteroidales bacterium]
MTRLRFSGAIVTLILLLSCHLLQAQGRFEISTGAGLFDGIFIKAKYGSTIQVGLSQDLVSQLHTTGLEVYYRLPRKSAPGIPGPFYLMCGVSTTLFGKGYDNFEQSFIYPRIGRSFLISGKSSRYGLNIDLGVAIHRYSNPPDGYISDFIPISGSLGFFYRL